MSEHASPAGKRGHPGFADRMSPGNERQDYGGSHIPTTPFQGKTIESGLEVIRGGIEIDVGMPTAGAGI